ncbi:hypothetical protein J6590_032889 [Homalodisca vitripennis]|nr:hypothetical protein J6590_032889 [Homalodisca vitripennis]
MKHSQDEHRLRINWMDYLKGYRNVFKTGDPSRVNLPFCASDLGMCTRPRRTRLTCTSMTRPRKADHHTRGPNKATSLIKD